MGDEDPVTNNHAPLFLMKMTPFTLVGKNPILNWVLTKNDKGRSLPPVPRREGKFYPYEKGVGAGGGGKVLTQALEVLAILRGLGAKRFHPVEGRG